MALSKRSLLVTTALPYANGPLHLGHLIEQIQADIWVRFQRLLGHDCLFVSGDDAHGTPIMLSAKKQGIDPETMIVQMQRSHARDSADFSISFDSYHTTHSTENKQLLHEIYQRLVNNGDIVEETIEQAFDEQEQMFLPDRFVKGGCPRCHASDQYGDNCEQCGATYNPVDLLSPQSILSGVAPVYKHSVHYFFQLPRYQALLATWLQGNALQSAIRNKLQEWVSGELRNWDISRDAPYFGFSIPDQDAKFFYVWMDAPVGYIAATKQLADQSSNFDFMDCWREDSEFELHHFIGKDIIYFHGLFWPAVLSGARLRLPTSIHAHGFLTINGKKMSKSRGNFITARQYLTHLDPEYLRYYIAAKLNEGIDDIDLSQDDFMQRVNADLVGKVINIASRSAKFIHASFDGLLADSLEDPQLFADFISEGEIIAQCFEAKTFSRAVRHIMALADRANQYIDTKRPWVLAKTDPSDPAIQAVCSMSIHLFSLLMTYLKPIIPQTASRAEAFLGRELLWSSRENAAVGQRIQPFTPLMTRIDKDTLIEVWQQ